MMRCGRCSNLAWQGSTQLRPSCCGSSIGKGAGAVHSADQVTWAETVIRTVALTWDAENNLTAWSDTDPTRPEGQQTTSAPLTYDDAGRKTSETVNYPNPAGSSYRLAYAYEYSKAGKKTKLTW